MYCSNCGSPNKTESLYCEKCGAELAPIGAQQSSLQGDNGQQVFKPVFTPIENTAASVGDPNVPAAPDEIVPAVTAPFAAAPVVTPDTGTAAGIEPLYTAAPAKKKSHKKLWIILASVFLVLVLAGGTCFAFRMQIMKTVAPQKYLQASLSRTLMGAKGEAPEILDLSKYTGKAVSHDFSLDTDEGSIDGSMKYDAKNEKALINMSVESNGTSYKDNQLFISPDLVAVSLPDMIKDTDCITVNPKTFADDWKEKGWDDQNMPLDNIEDYIHMFFGKETGKTTDKPDTDIDTKAIEEGAALWKSLADSAKFSSEGSVEEKIRGEEVRLDKMSYTVPENDANDFLQGSLSLIKDQILKQESQLSGQIPMENYEDQINTAFDELKNLEISGDVIVHFYIDSDGYVRKISTEDLTLTLDGSDADVIFSVEFGNGARPTDDMSATLSFEAEGTTSTAVLDSKASFEDGVYSNRIKLTIDAGDNQEDTLTFSVKWDKTNPSGDNLTIRLKGVTDGDSVLDMSIKGTLTDDKKSTSLTDATIEMNSGYGDTSSIDFSYSISIIDPSDIVMDTSDGTSLFEYKPFTDYMDSMTSN